MLLAALPSQTPSAQSQLSQSLAVDTYRGAADDETPPSASFIDSPQSELQGAMEVGAAGATRRQTQLSSYIALTRHFQDLSLAPSEGAASAGAHDHSTETAAGTGFVSDDAADPASPAAHDVAALPGGDRAEETPDANAASRDTLGNVLSPAAPMNLFSPSTGAEAVVSPSAVSSYAEATEALDHGVSLASGVAATAAAAATGDGLQHDVHPHEPQGQHSDDPLDAAGGSER